MDFFRFIADAVNANPGKTVGVALGFVLGLMIFTVGFWQTLLIVLLIAAGFVIGKSRDDNSSIGDVIGGFFRRRDRD